MQRYGVVARVFVACCSGLQALSEEIGDIPLVLVDVTEVGVAEAIRSLNANAHASGVRWQNSFQPINWERGFDDWRQFSLDCEIGDALAAPATLCVQDGAILVPLPAGTTVGEFRSQLMGALRHLRMQEVVTRPQFLEGRSEALADTVVHPRYTAHPARKDFRNATLVDNVVALDPAESGWRLYWLVVAARMAAMETGRPLWR